MVSGGSGADQSVEMELAWHLLTVLVRLGRPAAASDLAAAAAVSLDVVERMCHIDGSPLGISGGGLVTVSETAVLTFLRFVGCDVPAPRVGLRPPEVRRWWGKVVIQYERKRKVSDASCFSAKRRRLLAPDSDLMERSKHQSNQLVAQTCAPAATGEVHLEIMQELQYRLPTLSTFLGEPSLGFSTRVTLVPNVAKISTLCLQPKLDESLRDDDGTVLGNMALALVPTDLSDCCSINLLPLDAEKSKNIDAEVDDKISRIGESVQVSFLSCRVEDSDDLQKESVLPTTSHAILAGESKNEAEEDLNLVRENPGSPINYNKKTTDTIEASDMIPNQADALQHNCPNAGHNENVPTCGQEKNPLGANAYAEVCKDKVTHILLQPPMDTKAGSLAPQMNRNVEPETLLQEATRYDCMNTRSLNIIAENRESKYLNHEEQPGNEAEVNVSKNGQDRMVAKQKEKSKKNELPKEDKDRFAAKAQQGHVAPKPLPSFKGFVIEEEEGSGGYGTVYRARRKKDGHIFAIKCPHPNAHSHHVNNELKMLERFGGKNFVIKYECSLKSGDLECFVLEHVEHDRPEILKKDIALLELQWYGYCLFRALASLHKQGVVHRDVKPGNFLFCRKLKKGYLIDFNLANDLHQKFLKNCKSEIISYGKDSSSQTLSTSAPVVHAKEAAADSKQPLPLKRKRSSKSPVDNAPKIDNKIRHGSQAADVLFRSFHQGCKVDVWSAGVALLYFIIGRTPFGGDPEQNIKEIAKLKGSEELWEVAKLHNCEASYPSDLFDVKSFHSVDLREWCAANTRRPEFLKMIPDSLFDLVDKCLAVNPRCRLSSEDVLMHEFFAPCRDSFRKPRMLRRSAGSDAASSSSHQNTALTAKQS
ncbi:hypothetical protein BAE44_0018997 [Dichanthelium oligosanthes]|uniref:non-specific serine/threonine protein kinase n=1 Tax=Dichanthelium oligosanthes TaxID=888268 RepID=A0A1E5V4F2_9POAL|nr:hypothetical protein BAE44_0018997 [Dichanthelium oligosanthes]